MGWSWAPCLAHMLLRDLVEKADPGLTIENRMAKGLPCPQFRDHEMIHWEFFDDIAQARLDAPEAPDPMADTRERLAQAFKGIGGILHKEDFGPGLGDIYWHDCVGLHFASPCLRDNVLARGPCNAERSSTPCIDPIASSGGFLCTGSGWR